MSLVFSKADILADIRRVLNEPTPNIFSDLELNDLIDQGARSISILGLCQHQTEVETPVANTSAYPLATPIVKVEGVWYVTATTNTGLQRIDPRLIGHADDNTPGTMRWYWIFEQILFVWPPPTSGVASGGTLTVLSYGIIDNYTADLPDVVEHFCIDYVLIWAFAKLGKHNLSRYYMQKYLAEVFEYRRNVYDAIGLSDSKDRFKLPDFTRQIQ